MFRLLFTAIFREHLYKLKVIHICLSIVNTKYAMEVYCYKTNVMIKSCFMYYNRGENLLFQDVWMQKIVITILYDNNFNRISK